MTSEVREGFPEEAGTEETGERGEGIPPVESGPEWRDQAENSFCERCREGGLQGGNHGEQDGCGWQWTMQWAGQGRCEQTGAPGLEWIQHAARVPTSAIQAGPGHRGTLRMGVPWGAPGFPPSWSSALTGR